MLHLFWAISGVNEQFCGRGYDMNNSRQEDLKYAYLEPLHLACFHHGTKQTSRSVQTPLILKHKSHNRPTQTLYADEEDPQWLEHDNGGRHMPICKRL